MFSFSLLFLKNGSYEEDQEGYYYTTFVWGPVTTSRMTLDAEGNNEVLNGRGC